MQNGKATGKYACIAVVLYNVRIDVQINMKLELRLGVPSTLNKHNCLCRDENGFVSLSAVHVCQTVTDSYKPRISHAEHLDGCRPSKGFRSI